LPGGEDRRRLALGGVPAHPAAEDEARADHRDPAAPHGFVHDLHRAFGVDGRGPGKRDDPLVHRPGEDRAGAVRPRPGGGDVDHLLPDRASALLGLLHADDAQRGSVMRRFGWLVPAIYIIFLMVPIYWLLNMSFKTT